MRVGDVGYYSSLLRQREMMMPQLTEEEAEMVEMGPYYGMRDLGQSSDDGKIKKVTTAFTVTALVGAGVQGLIAYLLLANAGKWKGPWNVVGYVGGGLFGLGAVGGLLAGLGGLAGVRYVSGAFKDQESQTATP